MTYADDIEFARRKALRILANARYFLKHEVEASWVFLQKLKRWRPS